MNNKAMHQYYDNLPEPYRVITFLFLVAIPLATLWRWNAWVGAAIGVVLLINRIYGRRVAPASQSKNDSPRGSS